MSSFYCRIACVVRASQLSGDADALGAVECHVDANATAFNGAASQGKAGSWIKVIGEGVELLGLVVPVRPSMAAPLPSHSPGEVE